MKKQIVFTKVPASSKFKQGDTIEATGQELDVLSESGHEFITASEHAANERIRQQEERITKARETAIDNAIMKAVGRGAFLPKEDTSELRKKALKMEEFSDGMGVEHIDSIQAKETTDPLKGRQGTGGEGDERQLVRAGELSFRDTFKGILHGERTLPQNLQAGWYRRLFQGHRCGSFQEARRRDQVRACEGRCRQPPRGHDSRRR